ncbi:TVP38/TMEM64 family protein [Salipaludibacillus neizhouensis]|uniref:TVP38/TMEM64 family protein n=1 Tax=Salipaludibacillus neizhouensis TaxID=885475 RepID=UPI001CBA6957|nr:TVP38/TMEM64 family protein [Salipaludibacillus neizhouensis]
MQIKSFIKWSLVLFVILLLLFFNYRYLNIKPIEIREWILSFGILAPLFYIIVYTLRPLILFPASILSLAGGLAFGAVWGTILTVIGATGSAAVAFWVSRKLGKNVAKKEWKGKGEKVQEQLEINGFIYVIIVRLIPIFNFDMISYLSGISRVKFIQFILGTALGIIPGTFAYNFLGSSLVEPRLETILLAVGLFLVISTFPLLFNQK